MRLVLCPTETFIKSNTKCSDFSQRTGQSHKPIQFTEVVWAMNEINEIEVFLCWQLIGSVLSLTGEAFLFYALMNYIQCSSNSKQLNIKVARSVKNHGLAWRANQWTLMYETPFSSVPPSNSLVSVADPWPCLVRCFQNFRDTRAPSGVSSLLQRSQDTIKSNWRKP